MPKDTQLSYYLLRTIIGIIGVFLPVILIIGSGILTSGQQWVQPSISHYYYSKMHFVFMGALIILGITLIIYKGDKTQERLSTIAGFASFGIAIFPTSIDEYYPITTEAYVCVQPLVTKYGNYVHFGFATVLFICFAIFCFCLFQKSDQLIAKNKFDYKKKRRNIIYHCCGGIIVVCIICIALFSFVWKDFAEKYFSYYVITFEIPSLIAFGFSWLVKGSIFYEKSGYTSLSNFFSPIR
jgi:hypothetical protein